jgi:hypothetical protein
MGNGTSTSQAPEADLEEPQGDSTPAPEQAPEAPEATPDQPGRDDSQPEVPAHFQAEFTRRSQENAELKRLLGLPRNATLDAVREALQARQAQEGEDADGLPQNDTRYEQMRALAIEAQWDRTTAYYPGYAEAAREFADEVAVAPDDPEALTMKFYDLVQRFAQAQVAAESEAEDTDVIEGVGVVEPTPGNPAGLEPVEVGITDSDPRAPSPIGQAEAEPFKGTGKIAAWLAGTNLLGTREEPQTEEAARR